MSATKSTESKCKCKTTDLDIETCDACWLEIAERAKVSGCRRCGTYGCSECRVGR